MRVIGIGETVLEPGRLPPDGQQHQSRTRRLPAGIAPPPLPGTLEAHFVPGILFFRLPGTLDVVFVPGNLFPRAKTTEIAPGNLFVCCERRDGDG